jgi:hypothetical protein
MVPADNGSTQFNHSPVADASIRNTAVSSSSLSKFQESVPFLENSDTLLSIFHDRLAAQVPFVVIPPQTTAEDLHRDKPMLYMTIMFVASFTDMQTQQELGRLILEHLTINIILKGRKKFDFLQALLIYISWLVLSRCEISISSSNVILVTTIFVTLTTRAIISWDYSQPSL